MSNLQELSLDLLEINPDQPRQYYDPVKIQELADDMKKNGQLQAISVRQVSPNNFQIVFGARRFKAAQIAGFKTLRCEVIEISDAEIFAKQIAENIQREDMTPLDEAHAIQKIKELNKRSDDELAKQFSKPVKWVKGRLSLLDLTLNVQDKLSSGVLTVGAAIKIANLPHDLQERAIKRIVVSVPIGNTAKTTEFFTGDKDLKSFLDNEVLMPLRTADFDTKDKNLLPCGACTVCPKRTGNSLFDDFMDGEQCTDRSCYHDKSIRGYQKVQFDLQKKKKDVDVVFAARHYGTEKSFKDLGEVIPMHDYDTITEAEAKKDEAARYAVFVGIDLTDKEERIRHGWIKLKANALVREDTSKKKNAELDKQKEQERTEAQSKIVLSEIHKHFVLHEGENQGQMFIEIAAALWGQINQPALPWDVIRDLLSRYKLSFKKQVFNGVEWNDNQEISGKYQKPEHVHVHIETEELIEAVDEQIFASRQFSFLCELHFLATISHQLDTAWLKKLDIDVVNIDEAAVKKSAQTVASKPAKKEGKKKVKATKKKK